MKLCLYFAVYMILFACLLFISIVLLLVLSIHLMLTLFFFSSHKNIFILFSLGV